MRTLCCSLEGPSLRAARADAGKGTRGQVCLNIDCSGLRNELLIGQPGWGTLRGGSADKNTAATQARVLILLPRVKILKSTFSSSNESEGASEAVQAGFHGVLSRTFEDNGYTLRFDTTQMARWEETPKNDAAIKVLQDAYDSLFCPSAYSRPTVKRAGSLLWISRT